MLRILDSPRRAVHRRLAAACDGQAGQALVVVLAAVALLSSIPMAVIATTTNQLPITTANLEWNSAYEAAQAGLNDYTQRLDANETYSQFSKSNPGGNSAFSTWVAVPGASVPEYFEYAPQAVNGSLELTVSGKAGSGHNVVIRNFTYGITPTSTLNDIYWTNCESSSSCGATQLIVFDGNDVLNGPVFSNDDFSISGDPTFGSTVESANDDNGPASSPFHPGGYYWHDTTGSSAPDFVANSTSNPVPSYHSPENIISNGVAGDVAPAQDFGCYLTPTASAVTFALSGTTLTWSGGTLDTTDGNKGAGCGSSGTAMTFGSLKSALFFVNGNVTVSGGTLSGYLTLVSSGTLTITGSITYPSSDITMTSGTPSGPQYDTADALGLIAEDDVDVNDNNATTTIDAALMAISGSFQNADYTTKCSGTCPVLNVFGSIAQNIRGPMGVESGGTTAYGYQKSYWYDDALSYLWPPFYIPPASATWNPSSYAELKPGSANEAVPGT